jgi:hypothetical protein
LVARCGLEADHGLALRPRPNLMRVALELGQRAGVLRRQDLLKEADGGQQWVGVRALADERLAGIELGGTGGGGP